MIQDALYRRTFPSPSSSGRGSIPLARPRTRALALLAAGALCLPGCGGSSGSDDPGGGGGGGGGVTTAPSNLSYSSGSLFLTFGAPLPPVSPTVVGTPTSYSVSPALPAGITLDSTSGVIAGTPSERKMRASYQVTASNSLGSTTGLIDLEIVGPTRFGYVSCAGDDTLAIYAVEPTDGRLRFHGYHAQGAGEMEPGPLAVHPDGLAAYVCNQGSQNLSVHTLDTTTGRVGSTAVVPLGAGPHDLALLGSARFLYVSSEGAGTVTAFTVDQDGSLDQIGSVDVGSSPSDLVADPMGRYLVVLHRATGTISTWLVDALTGVLTSAGTWPAGAGTMVGATLAPSGKSLYVTLDGSDRILHFRVVPASATLQQGVSLAVAGEPSPPAVHPKGGFVYVADAATGAVARYSIDPASGSIASAGSTASSAAGRALRFDTLGEHLFALDPEASLVTTFRFHAGTGALSELSRRRTRPAPAELAFAEGDEKLAVRGSHLYVANQVAGTVSAYSIADNGTLTELTPPVAGGAGAADLALDPLGRYAFAVAATGNQLSSFTVQADGRLSPFGAPIALTGQPMAATVDPTGRWLYVTDVTDSEVEVYTISAQFDAGGVLTHVGARDAGLFPVDLQVDPTGQFLYVASRDANQISAFSIHPRTGNLTAMPGTLAQSKPTSFAFSPTGHRVYSTLSTANLIVPYAIDAADGTLTYTPPGTRALTLPVDVDISASGRYSYVALNNTGGVWVFDVRPTDGSLYNAATNELQPTGLYPTGTTPVELVSTPDERTLYVLNQGTSSISVMAIDGATGQLDLLEDQPTGTTPAALELGVRVD